MQNAGCMERLNTDLVAVFDHTAAMYYPSIFFRNIQPSSVARALRACMEDPGLTMYLGTDDPAVACSFIREYHPHWEVRMAAATLLPCCYGMGLSFEAEMQG
jgi:hypothetical protein